jgi:hypothetical protein
MTNLLDNATTWLADQLKNSAGRSIVYIRNITRIALTATRISEDEQAVDVTGSLVLVRQHSFVFLQSALSGLEPRAGDVIEENNGVPITWEVMPHGGGPPWQWEDAAGLLIRVYVKQVTQ